MGTLAEHFGFLRAYKALCVDAVVNDTCEKGSAEHFFADQFRKEAAGMVFKHLEELASLLPDQAELAVQTGKIEAEIASQLPEIRRRTETMAQLFKVIGQITGD